MAWRPLRGLVVGWAALFAVGVVQAHGVHETGAAEASARRPSDLWEWLFGQAEAAAHVRIDQAAGYRYIESDGLPDHRTGSFPNRNNPHRIQGKSHTYRVPLTPRRAGSATGIGHNAFGVAINGVPFDPATAEFWNRDRSWNYEAIGGPRDLGLDASNAHVQPDGSYHYHGIPLGILEQGDPRRAPMQIGWAADGFPIYAPWGYRDAGNAGSGMVELRSSYRLKSGSRSSGPGGRHDGNFASDFEFDPVGGDLDRCNGREGVTPEFPEGTYYYVLTDAFPFIPRCWVGQPDRSFMKRGGQAGGPGAEPRGESGRGPAGGPGGGRRGPPQEAIDACQGRSSGASCVINTPHGELDGSCRKVRSGEMACVPAGGPPPR
ncbi:MAG: YHYH protein [Chromatiales bacterium]|nr:YHYH protein [Gammaproteobacteria bacterium]MCP5352087.1 YHYH protein [Chromatiales bacterium]